MKNISKINNQQAFNKKMKPNKKHGKIKLKK